LEGTIRVCVGCLYVIGVILQYVGALYCLERLMTIGALCVRLYIGIKAHRDLKNQTSEIVACILVAVVVNCCVLVRLIPFWDFVRGVGYTIVGLLYRQKFFRI